MAKDDADAVIGVSTVFLSQHPSRLEGLLHYSTTLHIVPIDDSTVIDNGQNLHA